jgi:hypothetical protein
MKLQKYLAAVLTLTTLSGFGALPLTAAAFSKKVAPTVTIKTVPQVAVQSPRYKIDLFLEIIGANDGPFDNVLEVYGEAKINGHAVGSVARSNAQSKESGQILDIGQYEITEQNISIFANFNDKDELTPDDPVFRIEGNGTLNLANFLGSLSSRERTLSYKSGSGESSKLHIRVKRI